MKATFAVASLHLCELDQQYITHIYSLAECLQQYNAALEISTYLGMDGSTTARNGFGFLLQGDELTASGTTLNMSTEALSLNSEAKRDLDQ